MICLRPCAATDIWSLQWPEVEYTKTISSCRRVTQNTEDAGVGQVRHEFLQCILRRLTRLPALLHETQKHRINLQTNSHNDVGPIVRPRLSRPLTPLHAPRNPETQTSSPRYTRPTPNRPCPSATPPRAPTPLRARPRSKSSTPGRPALASHPPPA